MIINKKFLIIISLLLLVFTCLIIPQDVQAADDYKDYPEGLKILPDCYEDGNCDLNDFVQLFVNLAYLALKLLPYLAMIMMIWAGFNLIMSGGNPEKIQAGKKMVVSIVLGVMIVVILAWAFAFFIVIILTGNTTGETMGYIFKDYPWQGEWWGGGEGVIERVPGQGCCIVEGYGCTETSQGACISLGDIWGSSTQYMGDYQYCFQFSTICLNYQVGCCVPIDPDVTTCILPGSEGCLGDANIMRNYQHSSTPCENLAQCEEFYETPEIPDIPNPGGCCVTANSCDMASYLECNGDFHEGAPTCQAVDECNTGCCVYDVDCRASKVNCDSYNGQWYNDDCANVGCDTGCCVTSDYCYGSTESNCNSDPDFQSFNSGSDCTTVPQCLSGCCTDTCQDGRMDCDGLTYNSTVGSCSDLLGCQTGCCLPSGAYFCYNGFQGDECDDDGDTFWPSQDCSARSECNTGCCIDYTNNYICISEAAQLGCQNLGVGNYSFLTSDGPQCSSYLACSIDGCCVVDPDNNVCYDGNALNINEPHCVNILNGTFYHTESCSDRSECS